MRAARRSLLCAALLHAVPLWPAPSGANGLNVELAGPKPVCSDREVDLDWRVPGNTVVVLSLSGGGKRAAAYAYGVMSALQEIRVGPRDEDTLLHAVDYIAGVSGGAVPGAFYKLNRDSPDPLQGFDAFLTDDTERSLKLQSFLNPVNWWRLSSSTFSRTNLVAEYMDTKLYRSKTFGDLSSWPYLIVHATDLATGQRFGFTPGQFNCIKSDLGKFRLAHAVTASAAYPVYFPSLMLENFNFPSSEDVPPQRRKGPYVHLSDGGLVDNYAVRAYLDLLSRGQLIGDASGRARPLARGFVFIRVDASGQTDPEIAKTPAAPSFLDRLERSFGAASQQQNKESDLLFRLDIQQRLRELEVDCSPGVQFVYIKALLENADVETRVKSAPTRWTLDYDVIEKLIDAGRQAIRDVGSQTATAVELLRTEHEPAAACPPPAGR